MKKSLLVVLMLSMTAPAVAQTADPYAPTTQGQAVLDYAAHRAIVLGQIRFVYLAQGCKVLWGSGAQEATRRLLGVLAQEVIGMSLNDPRIKPLQVMDLHQSMADAVAQEGIELAKVPGKCQWFKEHPQAVADLREQFMR